jgi:hypothetical protein
MLETSTLEYPCSRPNTACAGTSNRSHLCGESSATASAGRVSFTALLAVDRFRLPPCLLTLRLDKCLRGV